MADLRVNDEFPGGTPGGPIEQVKRAVMVAIKEGLHGSTLGHEMSNTDISVEMEYPLEAKHYPGIWVQFSFTKFTNAGIGHEQLHKVIENPGTPQERVNWETVRAIMFEGTVSLSVVALTNLERDRVSDSLVTMLAYARQPEYVLTDPTRDTKKFRGLATALKNNPYVAIAIDHDNVTPGGQSVTPGVPWDPDTLGYEDSYSFSIIGESNMVFRDDGTYTLRAVIDNGEMLPPPTRFDWQ
ncbi:hypothetical protein KHO57_gp209 [Mycobacterium phage Phabba]|uniref:Uncharacterized protein n=1 Tax=Mycobacterium phage Phabba TaxID=2027899 RepID=A0A249XSH9_9CAUD|nr:hypothetical protein KHO57_gp209 [Mycobacterium phage Phabba]ASZ74695.1 hypothetical protein SEA_PHABBA_126 [Mycobacterium phage Phabba]